MTNALYHRGPDDESYYFSEPREGHISAAFGFRRLAIIDLSGGRQPMSNEDGTLWLVCNGEIYNYQDLRRDLEQRGHRFRTNCDVETVLHLYEETGLECCSWRATAWARSPCITGPRQRNSCSAPRSKPCCSIPPARAS